MSHACLLSHRAAAAEFASRCDRCPLPHRGISLKKNRLRIVIASSIKSGAATSRRIWRGVKAAETSIYGEEVMSTVRAVSGGLCVVALMLGAGAVWSQAYPVKPVRIITSDAGGGNDFAARLMAHRQSRRRARRAIGRQSPG